MDFHTESCAGEKDSITENTMAIAFDNQIQQWRTRIVSGPAGQFIRWWIGELRQLLPAQLQEKLQHALRRVTLSIENNEIQKSPQRKPL